MAIQTLNTIKTWFKTGLKPSQTQFWDTWDSFRHKYEKVPLKDVEDLESTLSAKAEKLELNEHTQNESAHMELFSKKEDITNKGIANGYLPLNEFTKIAAQYLNIVNDLATGGVSSLLSAEQGVVLQAQIDSINHLLACDDINLNTIQKIAQAIEQVQISLNTILINDLTTGGVTKALTAEMGKLIQANKEDKSQKGLAGGYAPLDEFTKLTSQYLNIVDNLYDGGSTSILSAEQGLILQNQIDGINTLLASVDIDLDTLQEIADAIKNIGDYLSTNLVNDLTTGGITKALTAEMGMVLQNTKLTAKMGTDAETQISAEVPEDNKVVSRLKLFNWWGWQKTLSQIFKSKVTIESTLSLPLLKQEYYTKYTNSEVIPNILVSTFWVFRDGYSYSSDSDRYIRKLDENNIQTLVATLPLGAYIGGMVINSLGDIFVGDGKNDLIYKVTSQGVVSTFASLIVVGGNYTKYLAITSDDKIYTVNISDSSFSVIDTDGSVTDIALPSYSGSGRIIWDPFSSCICIQDRSKLYKINPVNNHITQLGSLSLSNSGIVADSKGNIYLANGGESNGSAAYIDRITPAGSQTRFISIIPPGPVSSLNIDSNDNIFFSCLSGSTNGSQFYRVDRDSRLVTVAGLSGPTKPYSTPGWMSVLTTESGFISSCSTGVVRLLPVVAPLHTKEDGELVASGLPTLIVANNYEAQITDYISEDNKVISRGVLFTWWGWIKGQAQTISGSWSIIGQWTFNNRLTLAIGSIYSPPLIIPSGTLTTTPQNGAIERDSNGQLWETHNNIRNQLATAKKRLVIQVSQVGAGDPQKYILFENTIGPYSMTRVIAGVYSFNFENRVFSIRNMNVQLSEVDPYSSSEIWTAGCSTGGQSFNIYTRRNGTRNDGLLNYAFITIEVDQEQFQFPF